MCLVSGATDYTASSGAAVGWLTCARLLVGVVQHHGIVPAVVQRRSVRVLFGVWLVVLTQARGRCCGVLEGAALHSQELAVRTEGGAAAAHLTPTISCRWVRRGCVGSEPVHPAGDATLRWRWPRRQRCGWQCLRASAVGGGGPPLLHFLDYGTMHSVPEADLSVCTL
jgi:hypothetical protein